VATVSVSELTGAALDWCVAMSIGLVAALYNSNDIEYFKDDIQVYEDGFSPSTNWTQGGPLIDKYHVFLEKFPQSQWLAKAYDDEWCRGKSEGPTALIAICRAVVTLKLGKTVEIPEELK
jgi:hypothetical protein